VPTLFITILMKNGYGLHIYVFPSYYWAWEIWCCKVIIKWCGVFFLNEILKEVYFNFWKYGVKTYADAVLLLEVEF